MAKVSYTSICWVVALILTALSFSAAALAAPYPFFDDLESGTGSWSSDPPWALVESSSHSPTHAWTDSPGTSYQNNADTALTLASSLDLSSAVFPRLTFWHRYQIEAEFDFGYVEVSIDNGGTWSELAAYTGIKDSEWTQEQIDLTPYAGQSQVLFRFRLVTDKSMVLDGWSIDDVAVSEAPQAVTLIAVGNPDYNGLELTWTENLDPDFAVYKIFRSTAPGVSTEDTLAATISDQGATSYTDTGLYPETDYYYKVYVFNTSGAYAGSKEESGQTLPADSYFCGFEDGLGQWQLQSPWYITDTNAHTGSYCLTDSPGSYANSANTSAVIKVNLASNVMPVLTFWQRFGFQANADFGYVEASFDQGSTWERICFVTGSTSNWKQEKVDLTRYAGQPDVRIRFRLVSNGSVQSDGWYIDDVSIAETEAPLLPYPFFDDLSQGSDNWVTGPWEVVNEGPESRPCLTDSPVGNYLQDTNTHMRLILAGNVDLSQAKNPMLTFRHKHSFAYWHTSYDEIDRGWIHLSTTSGQQGTWHSLSSFNRSADWTDKQIDLSDYAGESRVRIKFGIYDAYGRNWGEPYYSHQSSGWSICDVALHDAPLNVTLNTPTSITEHSMDLSWSKNTDTDFVQYEIYRSTSPGVSRSSTLVATITDQNTTSYQDSDLIYEDTTYYYKVYVLDSEDLYNQGSNEVSGRTLDSAVTGTFPFYDDMESGDKWASDLPWAMTNSDSHSGSLAWTDSPGRNYENNMDRSMRTVIDLSGSTRPVLSFWHHYNFESYGDFGYLEVSIDQGASWSRRYTITGSSGTAWVREEISLSDCSGHEIWLRFRIVTNGSNTADGWYIDDVAITENTATASYPFYDDMESDTDNWILSTWRKTDDHSHSPSFAMTESPDGGHIDYANVLLVQRGTMDLSSATQPHLSYWTAYQLGNGCSANVLVSTNGGQTWTNVWHIASTTSSWRKIELDLSSYKNSDQVVVAFYLRDAYAGNTGWGWSIDDVLIGEKCPASSMQINPESASLLLGATQAFNATDENGTWIPQSIDWAVRGEIGSIDDQGLFTAENIGVGALQASICAGQVKAVSGLVEVVGPAGGTTQVEQGRLSNSGGADPGNGCVFFNAYIASRPEEILTQASPGCGYAGGTWQVNAGNFPTAWSPGETLHIDFIDACLAEQGSLDVVLDVSPQSTNLKLSPMRFDLQTTSSTNVNAVTLLKDSGLKDAEELAQAIPNALEVAYWDAEHQAYIGHTLGSPLTNFEVHPGRPYFVTVTAPGTWTPVGAVPDPWPSFDLLTTGQTNVNMLTLPLSMLRVTNSEELGHMILDCTEVAKWDAAGQGYVAHTYDTPLANFEVIPGQPYFVTVGSPSTFKTLAADTDMQTKATGVTQNEYGQVFNSDMSVPEDGAITFTASIEGRDNEVLTQDSVGCGYGSGYWQVNVGNFPTAWETGEILKVHIHNPSLREVASLEIVLGCGGQQTDVVLYPEPCEGNLDGDEDVDGSDLAAFSADFGRTDCNGGCKGDFDEDGDVDGSDLAVFSSDFGRTDCP